MRLEHLTNEDDGFSIDINGEGNWTEPLARLMMTKDCVSSLWFPFIANSEYLERYD
jgi:hypothetical protein